jgi:hypothetical protein
MVQKHFLACEFRQEDPVYAEEATRKIPKNSGGRVGDLELAGSDRRPKKADSVQSNYLDDGEFAF